MPEKIREFPRLAGRLYFFPALLPLAEIVPWLLTAIGVVAGVAGFSGWSLWRKYRLKIIAISVFCFIMAVTMIISAMPDKVVREQGTRLTQTEKLPAPVIYGIAPVAAITGGERVNFGEIWSRQVKKQVLSTPVIVRGILIFGSYEGSVEAISALNGAGVWSLPQQAPVFSIGRGDDGIVYAGEGLHETAAAKLTAIRTADGKVVWQRGFLGHIENSSAFDRSGHLLWTGTGPGGLWSLDSRNGKVLWHKAIGHIDSTPLAVNGNVYVPAQPDEKNKESILYALDAGYGDTVWQRPLSGQPWGSPVMDKTGKIILTTTGIGQIGVAKSSDRGWAHAVSVNDGKVIWQKELPGMPIQPDVYLPAANIIIYTLKTGDLVALNANNGEFVWHAKAGAEFQASATPLDGAGEPLIAATTCDGIFSIRRALTGEEVARRVLKSSATSSPASDGDMVYVTTAHSVTAFGGVHALRSTH